MMLHKKIISILLVSFLFSNGYAAYLRNVPQVVTQPDGTVIRCFASGDEFYNWLHDSAGYTIIQDAQTGYYVYAIPASDGQIAPSNHIVGIADPKALGLPVGVNVSSEIIMAKIADFEANTPKPLLRKAGGKNIGTINNIVIFIRFADDTDFSKSFGFVDTMFNDSSSIESNSMYNFYRLASYGQLYIKSHFYPAPSGDVILTYQDDSSRSYYSPYSTSNPNGFNNSNRTSREHALLERAVQYVASSIPPDLDLDYNNDGMVDNICFIITGYPIVNGNILWPHRWSLFTKTVHINGKRVYDYNLNLANANGENPNTGVITHEMMHTLSAPDLYHPDGYKHPEAVGVWDLMASTNYLSPQGLSAYVKYKYGGWIDSIPDITQQPGTYTLYPANGDSPEKTMYKIYPNPDSLYQYLVLEYRSTASNVFEGNLPGSGILIYRINERFNGNHSYNGTTRLDEIFLFRPEISKKSPDGNLNKAYFSADSNVNRTEFGYHTDPYPSYSNGFDIENILISNITEAGDSIQFTFGRPAPPRELEIVTPEIEVECTGGARNYLEIKSDLPWEIVSASIPSWITILEENKQGRGNKRFSFYVQKREETEPETRTCTLYVEQKTMDAPRKTATVLQKSCVLSIENINQNTEIKIYPNPTNNQLQITGYELEGEDYSIYNIIGQIFMQGKLQEKTTINIESLATGMYYLKIKNRTLKLVKN